LTELRADLGQQLTVYAPQHPAVRSTRQSIEMLSAPSPQLEALRDENRDLAREVVRRGGVSGDPREAVALASELPPTIGVLDDDDPRVASERSQLRLAITQYVSVADRLDVARVELDTARADFEERYRAMATPKVPRRALRPDPLLVAVGAVVGGVVFAFFAAALVDLRSGRVLESWQIERHAGIPVLAGSRE
jgi:hypothetical protein